MEGLGGLEDEWEDLRFKPLSGLQLALKGREMHPSVNGMIN